MTISFQTIQPMLHKLDQSQFPPIALVYASRAFQRDVVVDSLSQLLRLAVISRKAEENKDVVAPPSVSKLTCIDAETMTDPPTGPAHMVKEGVAAVARRTEEKEVVSHVKGLEETPTEEGAVDEEAEGDEVDEVVEGVLVTGLVLVLPHYVRWWNSHKTCLCPITKLVVAITTMSCRLLEQ